MAYRIALHLLAAFWNLLLFVWSSSLKNTYSYHKPLGNFCLFSFLYSLAFAAALLYQNEFLIRLTWLGCLLPVSLLLVMANLFEKPVSKRTKTILWIFSALVALLGMSPLSVKKMVSYEPWLNAVYGPLEPLLRIGIFIIIGTTLWFSLRWYLSSTPEKQLRHWVISLGMIVYAIGGILSGSILPLFGAHQFIEGSSYSSVVWTSLAVWHVVKELNFRNEILSELDLMKRNLINHVTHEFRTPLGSIQSAVDMLRDPSASGEKKSDYMGMIQYNVSRLAHFVDELLDLAAIQQAKVTLRKKENDIHIILETAIQLLRPLAEQNKTRFELKGGSLPVSCDEEKISQVATNLLSNAIKASPGGRVGVHLISSDGWVHVSIEDDGLGIPPEDLENIFSSFFQVQKNPTRRQGTGLGLAIAKGWVESHGGKIRAESPGAGKGARFTFTLPLH